MNAAADFLGKAAAKARGDLQDLQRKSNQLGVQVGDRPKPPHGPEPTYTITFWNTARDS